MRFNCCHNYINMRYSHLQMITGLTGKYSWIILVCATTGALINNLGAHQVRWMSILRFCWWYKWYIHSFPSYNLVSRTWAIKAFLRTASMSDRLLLCRTHLLVVQDLRAVRQLGGGERVWRKLLKLLMKMTGGARRLLSLLLIYEMCNKQSFNLDQEGLRLRDLCENLPKWRE